MTKKVKLTPSQSEAIYYEKKKNVLVSASAGSGKTFVLTHRIIEKVKKGIKIDKLFVSTFTVKAAAELKNRIERELKKELRKPENSTEVKKLLFQALRDIGAAAIGTTDAFSSQLVKNYYNIVNIDPQFRVLVDKAEKDILKKEIFKNLLEERLSAEDSKEFKKMLKNFSNDRTVKGLEEIVYRVYDFCQSSENPKFWMEKVFFKSFLEIQSFSQLPETFSSSIKNELEEFFDLLEKSISEKTITAKTLEKASNFMDNSSYIFSALESSDYKAFVDSFDFDDILSRWTISVDKDPDLREKFAAVIGTKTKMGSVRKFIKKIKFSEVIEQYHPEALELVQIFSSFLLDFQEAYLKKKYDLQAYEFSDILHFAIEILESKEYPEIRESFKFEELMIDEYQDTNQAQEKIYQLLSNGHNLFLVGDIKQSIYGFRQADPDLFMKKYELYPDDDSDSDNRLILLQENFRSRSEVLDFTNVIFKSLMENYGEKEALKFPTREGELLTKFEKDYQLPNNLSPKAELLLHLDDQEEESDNLSDNEIEIAAKKIIALINSGVSPNDIVLLVRSKTNNLKIKEIFESYQLPIILDDLPMNYLKSIEIQVMLEVLRTINNPLFDISLIATLHSPLFNFTDEDLARISLMEGETFWEKLNVKALDIVDSQLYSKIKDFLSIFKSWREFSKTVAVHDLIDRIYIESLYPEYVSALPNGEQRKVNLQSLTSRAYSYERSGYKGLVKFIDMIDNYLSQNNDLDDVNYKLPANAVHVQTMHKSKGLEFDYVFIMNFHTKFNSIDLKSKVLLDKYRGFAMKYTVDLSKEIKSKFPHALVEMETLPYIYIKELKEKQIIEEEMRMLYVALTRAKKKVYMLGKLGKEAELTDPEKLDKNKLPSKGYLTWILSLQEKLKNHLEILVNPKDLETELSLEALSALIRKESNWTENLEDAEDFVKAKKIMNFVYPFEKASTLSSTLSPSSLERELKQYDEELEFVKTFDFTLDDFDSKVYSVKDKGTVLHEFMQNINYKDISLQSLQNLVKRMSLPPELEKSLNLNKVLSLFDTELGQSILKNVSTLKLEQNFSMLKSIKDTDNQLIDQTVVRGIIDGYFIEDKRIVLFDYKTDHYTKKSEVDIIKERYIAQQELYAEALSKAYPNLEIEKYLILFGGKGKKSVEIVRL
ncbi:MAG: helicase-exonuclease AddAB subunit AddA [Lactovum sp.]